MQQILLRFIKWSSLYKSVDKFMPKNYEIDTWSQSKKIFFVADAPDNKL